jgi:hypothetical protein
MICFHLFPMLFEQSARFSYPYLGAAIQNSIGSIIGARLGATDGPLPTGKHRRIGVADMSFRKRNSSTGRLAL